MPATAKTAEFPGKDGLAVTYWTPDAVNGNTIPLSATFLHVKNPAAGAASINVTFTVPVTVNGLAVSSRVVAVADGAEKFIRLREYYDLGATDSTQPGLAYFIVSDSSGILCAAIG